MKNIRSCLYVGFCAFRKNVPAEVHQIVFLGLVTGSAGLFLSSASSRLSSVHHYLIPFILGSPYYFTYKCASVTASEITSETLSENLLLYPYDSILYHAGVQCKTCKLQKPARSKHCSVCKTCIARHDHHCAWVNNCLGRANYHWFLALLASLGILLVYGSLLSHGLLASILPIEKQSGFKAFLDRWSYAITRDPRVGGVGLLALLTSPLAWGLFGYHVYLVWAGMTTNETNKWRMLREDMAHGLVFKRERLSTVVQVNGTATIYEWPVIPHQEIVRMTDGRRPRQDTFDEAASVPNDWEHCWRLSQVENIFDLGFAENLREIFFGTKVQR